jgi:hypothetical protein
LSAFYVHVYNYDLLHVCDSTFIPHGP